MYFRLRAAKNTTLVAPVRWLIDDIIIHSDTSLLNTNEESILPKKFTLHQNYPNPFNPTTTIRYDLPMQSEVKLTIYNVLGQEVETLVNGKLVVGEHHIVWDAVNIASGVYFVRLQIGEFVEKQKVVLMK